MNQWPSALHDNPRTSRTGRLLWITRNRVCYVGLLGAPAVRTMGCWNVYASTTDKLSLRIADGPWQTGQLAVVPPYTPHQVIPGKQMIYTIKLEAESADPARLPPELSQHGATNDPAFLERMHTCCHKLLAAGPALDLRFLDFDTLFFGESVPAPRIDKRIDAVMARIKSTPTASLSAVECAESVHLSFSRFLHLFKQEVGVPFRSFRTWKRARSLLHYINRDANLASVALDTGYPDSTHFSHSIRTVYGLRPKEMFAVSRLLPVYTQIAMPVQR